MSRLGINGYWSFDDKSVVLCDNGADKKLPAQTEVRKPTLQSPAGLTAETLIAWINTLTKTDTFAIPTLLDWVEQLATEEKHVEHLARCLTALQQLIAPGHELAARAVEAGVKVSRALDRDSQGQQTSQWPAGNS